MLEYINKISNSLVLYMVATSKPKMTELYQLAKFIKSSKNIFFPLKMLFIVYI